jgi:hypothetical protein
MMLQNIHQRFPSQHGFKSQASAAMALAFRTGPGDEFFFPSALLT